MINYINTSQFTSSTVQEMQILLCNSFIFGEESKLWVRNVCDALDRRPNTKQCFVVAVSMVPVALCVSSAYTVSFRVWGMRVCIYLCVCSKQWLKDAEFSLQVFMLYLRLGSETTAELLTRKKKFIWFEFTVLHLRSGCAARYVKGVNTVYTFYSVTCCNWSTYIMQVCWDDLSNLCYDCDYCALF